MRVYAKRESKVRVFVSDVKYKTMSRKKEKDRGGKK